MIKYAITKSHRREKEKNTQKCKLTNEHRPQKREKK